MTDWKQLRIQKGLSQQALANELGVHKQTYVSWEKNENYPREVIQKMHQIYQVTPPKDIQIELLKTSYSSGEISCEEFLKLQKELYEETNDIELGILALEAYIKLDQVNEASNLTKKIGKSIVRRIQYDNVRDAEFLAKLYYLRGSIYFNQKRNVGALEQLLCAEEMLEQIDTDKLLLRRVRTNITTVLSESGKEEEVLKYLEKVEDTYRDTYSIESEENRKKVMAWRLFIKGRVHAINEEYEKAIEYYEQAKGHYREGNALENVIAMDHSIADMQYRLGRYRDAVNTIHNVQQDEYRANMWVDHQETKAFSFIHLDQLEKAEKAALEILERDGVSSISIARAYRILARIYSYKNNVQTAAYFYGKAIDVLFGNRLEGSTQALLIEITHEYIDFNKNQSPHATA